MRILILGGRGMLGHQLARSWKSQHEVYITARGSVSRSEASRYVLGHVDAQNFNTVERAIAVTQPEVVVNCIGLLKRLSEEVKYPLYSIAVNAVFPHQLALYCVGANIRLVQISTDCVFSGRAGGYTEDDEADAVDLYGRTKYLGEVSLPPCVTIRTSLIGREIRPNGEGLVEWFLAQNDSVKGYTKAFFSGLTTKEFASVLNEVVFPNPAYSGVYHVAGPRISKHELLWLIRDKFKKEIEIIPNGEYRIDRSLDASRFNLSSGYSPPSWEEMVSGL